MLRRVAVAIREERASLRARRARIRDSGDRQGYYCYLANHSENEGEIPRSAIHETGSSQLDLSSAGLPSACFLFPLLYVHALHKKPKAE